MVSQFNVSDDYVQINYKGRPVRVAALEYGDFFKWVLNTKDGLLRSHYHRHGHAGGESHPSLLILGLSGCVTPLGIF